MQTTAEPTSEPVDRLFSSRQGTVRRAPRGTPRWAFAALGYALLMGGWALASPVGAAPDESAHAVRAAAAGQGDWQGQPAAPYQPGAGTSAAQAAQLDRQAQTFTVPAAMVPPRPCFAGRVNDSAACATAQTPPAAGSLVTTSTYATTAPPGVYAVAGFAMRLPQPLLAPGYAGRLALGLLCALLLAGAAWAAAARGAAWPLAGLTLAATPAVLFSAGAIGTRGVSLAAAICFASSLAAFWMGPPRRGLSIVVAVSGAALALATAGGFVALAAITLLALPLVRPRRLLGVPLMAVGVVLAGGLGGAAWALDHRPLPPGPAGALTSLATALSAVPTLLEQAIGVFGWSDVTMPLVAYVAWALAVAVLTGAALLLGGRRDRLALLLGLGGALAVATAAIALALAPAGWELQGGFVLPVLAAVPVVAGWVLQRAGVRPRLDVFALGAMVAAVQLLAFWESARRYAVGRHGPLSFMDPALWSPPGGWTPWVLMAAIGAALVAAALLPLTRAERDEAAWGPLIVVDPVSISR